MRDPKRIEPFLKQLQKHWEANPDLRFGQMVHCLSSKLEHLCISAEEDDWLEVIKKDKSRKILSLAQQGLREYLCETEEKIQEYIKISRLSRLDEGKLDTFSSYSKEKLVCIVLGDVFGRR